MSLIEVSLGYSYEQRALQHEAALELMLEMERAGKQLTASCRPSAVASEEDHPAS
jgi:hypothetical protein